MNKSIPIILLVMTLSGLSACTWVKLSPEAESVTIITASETAAGCKLLGKTTVMVKATVATFARNKEKVQLELETLARNNALELKGTAVKAITEIKDGKQTYEIYQCP